MPADTPTAQGFGRAPRERLPMPAPDAMTPAQKAAADALVAGPRKGVYGPFLPLLRSPELLDRVARLGEVLRFGSSLPDAVRELAICATARHVGNQFEWLMHEPLARKAGVPASALEALRQGARPQALGADEQLALDFAQELLRNDGVCDTTWEAAVARFGDAAAVELATLVGYFVMVSWVMNVARTPPQATAEGAPLEAFPL